MSWQRLDTPADVERVVSDRTALVIDAAYDLLRAETDLAHEDIESLLVQIIPVVEQQIRGGITACLDRLRRAES